jgi:hypothetical protein
MPVLPTNVQTALDQGNRLEAIQLLRDQYGLDLKESLEVIAGLKPLPSARQHSQNHRAHTRQARTPHISRHPARELAFQLGEALRTLLGGKLPPHPQSPSVGDHRRAGLAPGEVPPDSGGWVLVAVVALIGGYFLLR